MNSGCVNWPRSQRSQTRRDSGGQGWRPDCWCKPTQPEGNTSQPSGQYWSLDEDGFNTFENKHSLQRLIVFRRRIWMPRTGKGEWILRIRWTKWCINIKFPEQRFTHFCCRLIAWRLLRVCTWIRWKVLETQRWNTETSFWNILLRQSLNQLPEFFVLQCLCFFLSIIFKLQFQGSSDAEMIVDETSFALP